MNGMNSVLDITWPPGDYETTRAADVREAVFYLKKFRPDFVWSSLKTFENTPCTLPQTQTILQGQSVGGVSLEALDQVRRMGRAVDVLLGMLGDGSFAITREAACRLHAEVARDEALEWGVFRAKQVYVGGVAHVPPPAETLAQRWDDGVRALHALASPGERALALFLFMARNQFFYDGNKRTAWLMMAGTLVVNGYLAFAIPPNDAERFNQRLAAFYDSGDAGGMMELLMSYGNAR